ncbi:homeobox protein cut-like 1 isoform X1 [Acanthaster planci]|uniref:Homeobox protein cut-like n=1 Tax=Acanthaster planci TaxID=133434 RepID=A0A8B7ZVW3_ACAPL|nr:homeobox protein cut-like 1 isoform X1 [Acanthaster planci]
MAAANISSMFQYWKNFDLPLLQRELDTTATELASRQDESDTSRKRLVEQSREFKKNTPDDIRKSVAPLLKLFQSEIDALSKRSKAAEASFLSVYKKLIDLPDPVSVLDHSLNLQKRAQKAQDLEVENQKLRETLEEYNLEFAEVKNQEVTIKNLKEKLREYEERMESAAQSRAKEKEKELQREFLEKERHLQETQLTLATKLGEAELKIQTLQNALDGSQSELFDLRGKFEEQAAAKSDEVDMLMTDLERSNQRQTASEKELETLRAQLASATQALQQAEQMQKAPSVEQAIDILTRSSLEVELSAKEKEITQLVEDVQRLQAANTKMREGSTNQIQKLEEQVSQKNAAIQKLEEQIRSQSDYDEIKRELSVLKSIEFSTHGSDVSESGDQTDGGTATPKSLEMLLLEKNRALQSENTTLKVTKSEINTAGPGGLAQAQAFASLIGQEVAAAYSQQVMFAQQQTSSGSQIIQPIIVIPPSLNSVAASSLQHLHMLHHHHQQQQQQQQQHRPHTPNRPRTPKSESQVNPIANHEWLDTIQIARRVKEVLTEHNIGQRIFGEHVLGLSQGSVSDILSRTKTWDKLTLKGREPFLKMVQFLSDRQYVEQLKILSSHKKGKEVTAIPTNSATGSDNGDNSTSSIKTSTEEAINNILALAKQEMESKNIGPGMVRPGDRRCENPNSHPPHRHKAPTIHNPGGGGGGNNPRHNGHNVKVEKTKSSTCALTPSNQMVEEPCTNGVCSESADEGFSSRDDAGDIKSTFMSINPRMPRRSMAPLTVQQYELNRDLDTLEIARQVREQLARGNIPQRVFGYHVIGLSQGSVSDILSKPKPWDKLTVKGREPFIRMKLWLEDPDGLMLLKESVRKASGFWMEQQRPPSTGTDTSDQQSASEMSPGPSTPILSQSHSDNPQISTHTQALSYPTQQQPASPLNLSTPVSSSMGTPASTPSTPAPSSAPTPPIQAPSAPHVELQTPSPPQHFPELPPVHEQAAMIEFLDTFELTRQVKAILQQHGVGQKAFGEAVLGLTQGSVSDLLSKPKMWLKLSMKGREPYIRMYLWLQDKDGVEKVKNYRPVRRPKRFSFVDPREVNLVGTPMKKPRILLSPEDKEALLSAYNNEPYPSQSAIEHIASDLRLPVSTVINWFHNHRSRLKRGHTPVEDAANFMIQTADGNIIGPDGLTATHAMVYGAEMTAQIESTSPIQRNDDDDCRSHVGNSPSTSPKSVNGGAVIVESTDDQLLETNSLETSQNLESIQSKASSPLHQDTTTTAMQIAREDTHQATCTKSTDHDSVRNGEASPTYHGDPKAGRQGKKVSRREQELTGVNRGIPVVGVAEDQMSEKDAYSILQKLESGVRDGSGDEWEF